MGDALLRHCPKCDDYTLREACPRCGGPAKPNRPAKFSPEDHYGEYRRRLKLLEKARQGQAGGSKAGPASSRP